MVWGSQLSGTLHITNGDVAGNTLKASTLAGDILPWRDPMHHGPFPASLDLDAVSKLHAVHLAGNALDAKKVEMDFLLRNDQLRAAPGYQEVVLWFEHDLLDQLQILQLLDWFAGSEAKLQRLTLICVDAFPGIDPFLGLGQMGTDQMESVFDRREAVTAAQIHCAIAGWRAFRSSHPPDLTEFMKGDLSPLPFLRAALDRYIEEFPWTTDGLTRTERQILNLVAASGLGPGEIFTRNMELETALFIGDWTTFDRIARLCAEPAPLLPTADGKPFRHPPAAAISREEFLAQRLKLTDAGETALATDPTGELLPRPRDEWLGGVHLQSGAPMWMFDPRSRNFLQVGLD